MQEAIERWRSEKTAAHLSSAVAAVERDPAKAKPFRQMAATAQGPSVLVLTGVAGLLAGALLIGSAAATAAYGIGSLFDVSGI